MENAKDRLAEKKSELVTVLDGLGMSSRKLGDINLILRTDSRPEVTDFDGLTDYIKNVLDEPLSEYTKLSFDPKKLRELIKDANEQSIREHKPLVECMPAGLESHITKTIVVRGYKAETSKTTNKEEIL